MAPSLYAPLGGSSYYGGDRGGYESYLPSKYGSAGAGAGAGAGHVYPPPTLAPLSPSSKLNPPTPRNGAYSAWSAGNAFAGGAPPYSPRNTAGYNGYGLARCPSPSPYGDELSNARPVGAPHAPAPYSPRLSNCYAAPYAAPGGLVPPQSAGDQGKYSLVFDLDETLVYARDGPVRARPGSQQLLQSLGAQCELIVWTSSERSYAANAIRQIDTGRAVRHTVARGTGSWYTGDRGCSKKLHLLGRDLSKTLLVENTPDCIRDNRDNALLLPDFVGGMDSGVLSTLQTVLQELQRSGKSVPEYLRSSPHVTTRTVTCQAGGQISCYTLQAHPPRPESASLYNAPTGSYAAAGLSYAPPSPRATTAGYSFAPTPQSSYAGLHLPLTPR